MENLTHENSYSKLAALIKVIENDYRIIKEKWKKSGGYKKINMRYIIPQDENISLIEIFKYLKENFSCYKCTDANKEIGYRAVHLYFSEDNFDFPWELQIWEAEDATNNIKLHKKYKQAYTAWEKQSKKEG